MTIFEKPLVGFSRAEDPCYEELRTSRTANLVSLMMPGEWLPGARTVISFFFPFTDEVVLSNREKKKPSHEWLHGRWEGQKILNAFAEYMITYLKDAGYAALAPGLDERFRIFSAENDYSVNWSERHAAHVSGLGTFGLSRGLITEKGMAGRFISLVTDGDFPPTPRSYGTPFEYCIRCGACIDRCPPRAISLEKGKDQKICGDYCGAVKKIFAPRYGCGKCQTDVPCSRGIPDGNLTGWQGGANQSL